MSTDREMLVSSIESDLGILQVLRSNAADPKHNAKGGAANVLGLTLRDLGVSQYLLDGDEDSFRACLSESVLIAIELFNRFESGDPISPSYVSMLAYKDLFDALAIGDMANATGLALHMGGRPEIEQKYDHPFDRAMGYALRAFVLRDPQDMSNRSAALSRECEKKGNSLFRGYARVLEAILDSDTQKANAAFVDLIKGHKQLCTGSGVFRFAPDRYLCVWGLGLANLARFHGMAVAICDPLIPSELIA